jgi:hypothetical protein
MELALNLVWFIVAVGSYALLARRVAGVGAGHSCGPSRCQCIVALSCALVILFPVISLTDDLHEMQAAAEEPSSSCAVMKKCGVNHPLAPIRVSHQLHYIHSKFVTTICWVAFGIHASRRAAYRSLGFALATLGRAPPSFVSSPIS